MAIPLSLFLNWFEIPSGAKEGNFTGWYSFHRSDRVLAVIALAAVVSGFLPPLRRVAAARLVLGLLAIAVVVREMATPPIVDPGIELRTGAYLGLAGALGVALGGLLAFDRVRRRSLAALKMGPEALAWLRGVPEPSVGEHAPSPRLGRGVFRGVPSLSPGAFGLFRIAFGLGLLWVMVRYVTEDRQATPIDAQGGSTWFVDGDWVRWLASSADAIAVVQTVTVVALVFFVAGLATRFAYSIAAVGLATTALVVVALHGGAHDWGLPAITSLSLLIVPWGDSGFSVDALIRSRRGRSLPDRPSRRYGLAVWIPGLTMGVAFLAAAHAKLTIGGPGWVTEGAVKYHFVEDARNAPVDWGLRLTSVDELAVLMSLSAVVIEATFVLVTLSSRPTVRLLFGLTEASLLTGFFLFQGVFWTTWWVLLLAFVPWEGIYRTAHRQLDRRAARVPDARSPVPLSGALRIAALGLVGVLVVQQVLVSAKELEELPFLSNFPMYAGTWDSEEQFNAANRRFVAYRFEVTGGSGQRVDITARIEAIRGNDPLVEAYEARDGEDLDDDEVATLRSQLRVLDDTYQRVYGGPLGRVHVISERTAGYDFERRAFRTRVVDRTTHVVEPRGFDVASAQSG